HSTHLMREILDASMSLIDQIWHPPSPIRLINVTALDLTNQWETYEQEDLFAPAQSQQDQRLEKLEQTMDDIRRRFGGNAISYGESPESNTAFYSEEEQ